MYRLCASTISCIVVILCNLCTPQGSAKPQVAVLSLFHATSKRLHRICKRLSSSVSGLIILATLRVFSSCTCLLLCCPACIPYTGSIKGHTDIWQGENRITKKVEPMYFLATKEKLHIQQCGPRKLRRYDRRHVVFLEIQVSYKESSTSFQSTGIVNGPRTYIFKRL